MITVGLYRHYKGGLYRVLLKGRDADDGDTKLAYMDIGTGRIYIRKEEAFMGSVEIGGVLQARYQRIGD